MKAVTDLRADLTHRIGTSREELAALIKASHGELSRHLERMEVAADEQRQRLLELERDFDEVLDGGRR